MNYSSNGLHLTEQFEGIRYVAYQDSGGVLTIGYGHTHGVTPGMVITQAQAEEFLREDIQWAEKAVSQLVRVPLTQGEFDALVDWTFNCGSGTLARSSVLTKLNAGDYHGAAVALEQYDHAGGKVLAGLLRRRKAEEALMEEK